MATAARVGLEIRLLGPVEAVKDGRVLDLGGPRQRALLAVLALHANEVVTVDRLVEASFGLDAPESAANAVQVAVSRLRRRLDPGVVETRAGGYVLAVPSEDVDAQRFERLLDEGKELLRRGDATAAATTLREALDLFRGEPLADLAGEEFAQPEIRRLEALRLDATAERIDADLTAGRGSDLVPELETLAGQHPLQERLRAQLMLALYRAGRQSDALAEYRRMRVLLDEQLGLEPSRALQELEQAILRHDPALDPAAAPAPREVVACPFKGLASFTVDDAEIFFGRGRVIDALVAQLASGTFVGLVGPSGSGKSSLLQAGLLRALRAGALPGSARWAIALLRPGDAVPSPNERTVVVVDQLEELFTGELGDGERRAFLDALVALATDPKRRSVVAVALRADFYGRLAAYPDFASLLSANHVLLGAMKRDELVEAIQEPAARAGLQVERRLVDALVADVEDEPGSLPLLSSALLELWQERDGTVLTEAGYRYLGGLRGAIARLAESAFARLGEEERTTARAILLRLATEEDGAIVRRRVPLDELGRDAERVLHVLADARLITVSDRAVEVSHEALLTEWPRLHDWLDEDRDTRKLRAHLAASARDWAERGRNREDLYRGPRLAAAAEWIETRPAEPTQLEREFVDESRAERERELARQRRRNRQLLTLLAGTALLLVAAIVAGAIALSQRRDARRKATAALAGQVGAAAVSQPRIDLAMLLAAQAVRLDDSPQTESTLLATLLRSPSVIGELASPIDSRPQRLVVSPDGRTLAVSDNQSTVRFYDIARRRVRATLRGAGQTQPVVYLGDGRLAGFAWDPKHGPFTGVYDTRTLRLLRRLPPDRRFLTVPTGGNAGPIATRDGSTILSGYDVLRPDGSDGAAYVDRVDVATGHVTVAPVGSAGFGALRLVDGDRRLVVVGTTKATILDARSLKPLRAVTIPPDGFPASVAPDGRTIAVGSSNGLVTLVSLRDGRRRTTQGAHPATVGALAFAHDGRLLASAGDDGTVIVWDVATGAPTERFTGHANRLLGIAFSPDDKTLWTCSLDGAIFSWDLGTSRRLGTPFSSSSWETYGAPDFDPDPPLAISSDGSRFAVRSGRKAVQIRSTQTSRVLASLELATGNVTSLAFSPTAPLLAVTSTHSGVEVWNVTGTPRRVAQLKGLRSVNGQAEVVEASAFSPDGRYFAAGDVNHTRGATPYRVGAVAVWQVSTGRLRWLVRNRGGWVHKLAFSPDGPWLAAAQEDGRIRVYDSATGKLEQTMTLYGGSAENAFGYDTLAFGRDGTVATGTWAGIAQVWDVRTGRGLTTPTLAAAAPVSSLAFDPTGRLLASVGGSDGTLKLWRAPDLSSFGADFPLEATQWGSAAFTPDGSRLVVVFSDGHGVVWPAKVSAWLRHACAVAGRDLTRDEWARYIGTAKYERTCP